AGRGRGTPAVGTSPPGGRGPARARSRGRSVRRREPWSDCAPALPGLGLRAPEVVLEATDVVLTGVGAALHLDDHQLLGALVAQPVRRALGDVDGLAGADDVGLAVDDRGRDAEDDHPVLGAVFVGLV